MKIKIRSLTVTAVIRLHRVIIQTVFFCALICVRPIRQWRHLASYLIIHFLIFSENRLFCSVLGGKWSLGTNFNFPKIVYLDRQSLMSFSENKTQQNTVPMLVIKTSMLVILKGMLVILRTVYFSKLRDFDTIVRLGRRVTLSGLMGLWGGPYVTRSDANICPDGRFLAVEWPHLDLSSVCAIFLLLHGRPMILNSVNS